MENGKTNITADQTSIEQVNLDLDSWLAAPGADSIITPASTEEKQDDKKPSFFSKNSTDLSFLDEDDTKDEELELGNSKVASKEEIAKMFEHLEEELDNTDFFKVSDKRPKMVRNIRNIFIRANLTDQDVRTIRGLIKSLTKR